MAYPIGTIPGTVNATNDNMNSDKCRVETLHKDKKFYPFTRGRFLKFLGITLRMALDALRGGMDACWREHDDEETLARGGRYGSRFGMNLEEFKNIRQYLKLKPFSEADLLDVSVDAI